MVVSDAVGLRNISVSKLVAFLMITRSKKLIHPSVSGVGLRCKLLCIVFAYCSIALGFVHEKSDYNDTVHIFGVKCYVFGVQEVFYVGVL